MPSKSPGVYFPPPLLFVAEFALAWLLHRRWPLVLLQKPSEVLWIWGWLLNAAGELLPTVIVVLQLMVIQRELFLSGESLCEANGGCC